MLEVRDLKFRRAGWLIVNLLFKVDKNKPFYSIGVFKTSILGDVNTKPGRTIKLNTGLKMVVTRVSKINFKTIRIEARTFQREVNIESHISAIKSFTILPWG